MMTSNKVLQRIAARTRSLITLFFTLLHPFTVAMTSEGTEDIPLEQTVPTSNVLQLETLPIELQLYILHFAGKRDVRDLARMACTCRHYRALSQDLKEFPHVLEKAKSIHELTKKIQALQEPITSQELIDIHNKFLALFDYEVAPQLLYPRQEWMRAYQYPLEGRKQLEFYLREEVKIFYHSLMNKLPQVTPNFVLILERAQSEVVQHIIHSPLFWTEASNLEELRSLADQCIQAKRISGTVAALRFHEVELEQLIATDILCPLAKIGSKPLLKSLLELMLSVLKDPTADSSKKGVAAICIHDILRAASMNPNIPQEKIIEAVKAISKTCHDLQLDVAEGFDGLLLLLQTTCSCERICVQQHTPITHNEDTKAMKVLHKAMSKGKELLDHLIAVPYLSKEANLSYCKIFKQRLRNAKESTKKQFLSHMGYNPTTPLESIEILYEIAKTLEDLQDKQSARAILSYHPQASTSLRRQILEDYPDLEAQPRPNHKHLKGKRIQLSSFITQIL